MDEARFERSIRFLGRVGQEKLRRMTVSLVGVGGIGTHVAQQLGLLGVGALDLIDYERVSPSNRNRYVGITESDINEPKVCVLQKHLSAFYPETKIRAIEAQLLCDEAFQSVREADCVFGCVDNDGSRLILNELCSAYNRPYIDVASDVVEEEALRYGGRVCANWSGNGCLVCLAVLDLQQAQEDLLDDTAREDRDSIYGVSREELDQVGPSVVFINGIVASWAVAEFCYAVTGIRKPHRVGWYRGHLGTVTVSDDRPQADCYYCRCVRGRGAKANMARYLGSSS